MLAEAKSLKGGKVGNIDPILNRVARVGARLNYPQNLQQVPRAPSILKDGVTHGTGCPRP